MDADDHAPGDTARREPGTGIPPGVDPPWVAERVDPVRPSLQLDRSATAQDVATMRRAFARWLAVDVAAGDRAEDLVLVVYEALANAADHAYGGGEGPVRLVAHRAELAVRVTVADEGRWQPTTDTPFRNHGLFVMRMLVARLHVASTASGTVVHLHSTFPPPVPGR